MLNQEQHKRFAGMSDTLSSPGCYWYALANSGIVPTGSENDRNHQRPDAVHT